MLSIGQLPETDLPQYQNEAEIKWTLGVTGAKMNELKPEDNNFKEYEKYPLHTKRAMKDHLESF